MAANGQRRRDGGRCALLQVDRWTLLSDNATLCRVGLNPRAVEHGGLSQSSERYIARVLAPVVNAMLLPAAPTPVRAPRRRRRDSSLAAIDTAATEQAAKLGSVEVPQLPLMETPPGDAIRRDAER